VHDVIVVGAGGSGAPLAARLAAAGASVLLLEAGDTSLAASSDPRAVPGARPGHPGTVASAVELRPGRPWTVHRGQGLGGSTAVNGGYFVRPRPEDLERWAEVAGPAWSFDAALPVLRDLETDVVHGDTALHGGSGPVTVDRTDLDHAAARAFVDAATALGAPLEHDKNAPGTPGVGAVPVARRDGRRVTTATAYLSAPPPSLEIRGGTRVLRLLVDGDRVTGVDTDHGRVLAGEVVLAAGAVESARLLLLSGLGPVDDLAALGIDVVADLPVGRTVGDHPQIVLGWSGHPDPTGVPAHWIGAALHTTSPGSPWPGDVEILQSLLPLSSLVAGTLATGGGALLVGDLAPVARGKLRLTSADPDAPALVSLDYLRDERDRAALRFGVRTAATLLKRMLDDLPGSVVTGPEARELDDDALLDAWIEAHLGTAVHTCATAPIGSVVDGRGRVHGVRGLRVADTSILPSTPLRGPAASAVLVGEVIARALLTTPDH